MHHFEFEFVSSVSCLVLFIVNLTNMNCSFSFELKLSFYAHQAIEYEVGDVLEILPSQNPAAVDAFLLRCNLDPEAFITVSSFLVHQLNVEGIVSHL